MSDFYLTLPSNSSMDVYPDNTLTRYQTKLPHRIELEGRWEVGLVELQYPHNWYNVPKVSDRQMAISHVTNVAGEIEIGYFSIPPGYYNPSILLQRIKAEAKASLFSQEVVDIKLEHDEVDQMYVADLSGYVLDVGPHVSTLLGLDDTFFPPRPHRGESAIDIDPIHSLYVYCDLIEPRVVGDVLAPLLRIVPVTGKHGETVMKSYENVHYIPLQRRAFENVEIDIRDRAGKSVPFERGTLNVTLHFRRRRRVL